jgi:hypothetical protein
MEVEPDHLALLVKGKPKASSLVPSPMVDIPATHFLGRRSERVERADDPVRIIRLGKNRLPAGKSPS